MSKVWFITSTSRGSGHSRRARTGGQICRGRPRYHVAGQFGRGVWCDPAAATGCQGQERRRRGGARSAREVRSAGRRHHASKWALECFSEALAQEVAGMGIKVTLVGPGGVSALIGLHPPQSALSRIPPTTRCGRRWRHTGAGRSSAVLKQLAPRCCRASTRRVRQCACSSVPSPRRSSSASTLSASRRARSGNRFLARCRAETRAGALRLSSAGIVTTYA